MRFWMTNTIGYYKLFLHFYRTHARRETRSIIIMKYRDTKIYEIQISRYKYISSYR